LGNPGIFKNFLASLIPGFLIIFFNPFSYCSRPVYRIQAVLGQEGEGDALEAEGDAAGVGWGAVWQADVQAPAEEILVIVVRADRKGAILEG
jgi:hypothetical protein